MKRIIKMLFCATLCLGMYSNPLKIDAEESKQDDFQIIVPLDFNGSLTYYDKAGNPTIITIKDSKIMTRAGLTVNGKLISQSSKIIGISFFIDTQSFTRDNQNYYTRILAAYGAKCNIAGPGNSCDNAYATIVRSEETANSSAIAKASADSVMLGVFGNTYESKVSIKNAYLTLDFGPINWEE